MTRVSASNLGPLWYTPTCLTWVSGGSPDWEWHCIQSHYSKTPLTDHLHRSTTPLCQSLYFSPKRYPYNTIAMIFWLHKPITSINGLFNLFLYILATSKIISDGYLLVSEHSHGDFTVLPHWETRPPAWWPDIPLSHIILRQSQPVFALS